MEQWTHWEPIVGIKGRFFIQNLQMTNEGLLIELYSQDNNRRINIVFINGVDAYKCTNESWCFDIFAILKTKYGPDFYVNQSFFEITHSQYAKSLALTSCGLSDLTKFRHFCIVGDDEVVDILARYEPDLTLIS